MLISFGGHTAAVALYDKVRCRMFCQTGRAKSMIFPWIERDRVPDDGIATVNPHHLHSGFES